MLRTPHATQIDSSDFDAFVSEVAAAVWNQLIEKPAFSGLKIPDYIAVFEAVASTLRAYQASSESRRSDSGRKHFRHF